MSVARKRLQMKGVKRNIEYLIVHELVHLVERTHNDRFLAMMDAHLPDWKAPRTLLNAQPLAHDTWGY
jgi:predicted metal-dependent hydrolase